MKIAHLAIIAAALAACSHSIGHVVTDVRPNTDGSTSVTKCDAQQAVFWSQAVSLDDCRTEKIQPGVTPASAIDKP